MESIVSWWFVNRAGYKFVDTEGRYVDPRGTRGTLMIVARTYAWEGLFLVPSDFPENEKRYRRDFDGTHRTYEPMDDTSLFLKFAEIRTPNDVLNFANQYGPLSRRSDGYRITVENVNTKADPLDFWLNETTAIRQVWNLWQAIRNGGLDKFKDDIERTPYGIVTNNIEYSHKRKTGSYPGIIFSTTEQAKHHVLSSRKDPTTPYQSYYTLILSNEENTVINQSLDRGDFGKLALLIINRILNQRTQSGYGVILDWRDNLEKLDMKFLPETLLDALWLQLEQAIAGNRAFQVCEQCGSLFEISQKAKNKGRVYCSDACKSKAYRERLKTKR